MAALHEPPRHVAAHPAQPHHSELHGFVSLAGAARPQRLIDRFRHQQDSGWHVMSDMTPERPPGVREREGQAWPISALSTASSAGSTEVSAIRKIHAPPSSLAVSTLP